jgi:uncharacterized protein YkwD
MSSRLQRASIFVILGLVTLFIPATATAQGPSKGLLSRLAARFHHHHQTAVPQFAAPATAFTQSSTDAASAVGADPYGFASILNRLRARAGLPPVAYDPTLSSWARRNNLVQSIRGLGHHVTPMGVQNCGWNYSDAQSVAQGWMDSPGHRQNMLDPSITRFGIAFGPGPYWTMNAR